MIKVKNKLEKNPKLKEGQKKYINNFKIYCDNRPIYRDQYSLFLPKPRVSNKGQFNSNFYWFAN